MAPSGAPVIICRQRLAQAVPPNDGARQGPSKFPPPLLACPGDARPRGGSPWIVLHSTISRKLGLSAIYAAARPEGRRSPPTCGVLPRPHDRKTHPESEKCMGVRVRPQQLILGPKAFAPATSQFWHRLPAQACASIKCCLASQLRGRPTLARPAPRRRHPLSDVGLPLRMQSPASAAAAPVSRARGSTNGQEH